MPAEALEQQLRSVFGVPETPEDPSVTDVRILDAALALIGEYGEQRLTIDDVAAEANVTSRTVFRRFGSRQALVARVYRREIEVALAKIAEIADAERGTVDTIVAAYVFLADYATAHPVIRRLARAEPETLVELWRSGEPSGYEAALLLLRSVAGADGQRGALDRACDLLARLLFAEQLLPLAGRLPGPGLRDPEALRPLVSAVMSPDPDPARKR